MDTARLLYSEANAAAKRRLRAESTGNWLRAALAKPTPTAEIFKLGKLEGVLVKGLKRAKNRLTRWAEGDKVGARSLRRLCAGLRGARSA